MHILNYYRMTMHSHPKIPRIGQMFEHQFPYWVPFFGGPNYIFLHLEMILYIIKNKYTSFYTVDSLARILNPIAEFIDVGFSKPSKKLIASVYLFSVSLRIYHSDVRLLICQFQDIHCFVFYTKAGWTRSYLGPQMFASQRFLDVGRVQGTELIFWLDLVREPRAWSRTWW